MSMLQILISMPIGGCSIRQPSHLALAQMKHPAGIVRYFVLFAGASNIRVLSCMNLTFLLPRSA